MNRPGSREAAPRNAASSRAGRAPDSKASATRSATRSGARAKPDTRGSARKPVQEDPAPAQPEKSGGAASVLSASERRRQRGSAGSYKPLIVLGSLIVVGIIVWSAWNPVRRWIALRELDTFKPEAQGQPTPAAKAQGSIGAADAYLAVVANDPNWVEDAIACDHGPVEAQIYLAVKVKHARALVGIIDRPESLITEEQRLKALKALVEIFDPVRDNATGQMLMLPSALEKWAVSAAPKPAGPGVEAGAGKSDPEILRGRAITATALLVKANRPGSTGGGAAAILARIAATPGIDGERIQAALEGLATLSENNADALGLALHLLKGPSADLVVRHARLRAALVTRATTAHLRAVLDLLGEQTPPEIRALALESLGAPGMRVGDDAAGTRTRRELGQQIGAKIRKETDKAELVGALKAARNLKLWGARDAVLALANDIGSLGLDGIDGGWLAACLAYSCLPPSLHNVSDDQRAWAAETVDKLIAGLENPAIRPVAAQALGLVGSGFDELLALRPALDRLAALGDEPACFTALVTLVEKVYQRPDVAKTCGNDLKAWRDFLAKDKPRAETYGAIVKWIDENGEKSMLVSTGLAKLTVAKNFIAKSRVEIDAWLADPQFVPPIGVSKDQVKELGKKLNWMTQQVNKAWSGAPR